MSLVAARLHALGDEGGLAGRIRDGIVGNQVLHGPAPLSGQELLVHVVHHLLVLQVDADGQDGGQVAQLPVGPVVQVAGAGTAVVLDEPVVLGIPDVPEPLPEGILLGRGPAGIAPQELGRIGERVALEAGQEVLVVVVGRDLLAHGGPFVQDGAGGLGVFRLPGNLPAQGELEGGRRLLVAEDVVLAGNTRARRIAPDDGGQGAGLDVFLRPGAGAQLLPGGIHRVGGVRRGDVLLHAGQVGRIDIRAGVAELHRHVGNGLLHGGEVHFSLLGQLVVAGGCPRKDSRCKQHTNQPIHT